MEKPTITEAEYEQRADALIMRRLATNPMYQHAENAEEQAQAEEWISDLVHAELTARYEVA